MIMTIVSYLVAVVAAFTFFHVFVHVFDIAWLCLYYAVTKARKRENQVLSHAGLFLQSATKGFCTNVLASLIGIGIIWLFGKNYLAFPIIYFATVLINEINLIKDCPSLRIKVELFILLGNLLAIIGVYSVIWFI